MEAEGELISCFGACLFSFLLLRFDGFQFQQREIDSLRGEGPQRQPEGLSDFRVDTRVQSFIFNLFNIR